jgi:hypothetical protein
MVNGFTIVNFSASRALNKLDMEDIMSEILKLELELVNWQKAQQQKIRKE